MNKMKYLSVPALAGVLIAASSAHAAITYTWTGNAGNGTWADTGNWDGIGVPVDVEVGGTHGDGLSFTKENPISSIVFNGSNMPTDNLHLGGSTLSATPTVLFNSGGTITMNVVGREDSVWSGGENSRTPFTIGDGIGSVGDSTGVILNMSVVNLSRDPSGATQSYVINSDGRWNVTSDLQAWNNINRDATITIAGGIVDVAGEIDDFYFATDPVGRYIDFTEEGATLSAGFGGDFLSIEAVNAQIGDSAFFRSSTLQSLAATDNLDGTFTVSAVPEPSSAALLGLGGLALILRRRK